MRQYVSLFEVSASQYTQDMALDTARREKNVFDPSDIRRMFKGGQLYLSQEIGDEIGAVILRKWHMPFGWSEDQTYRIFASNYYAFGKTANEERKAEYLKLLREIVDEVIRLNPDITKIQNYKHHIWDIMHGMISRFNFDDIDFFISFMDKGMFPARSAHADPDYEKLSSAVSRLFVRMFPFDKNGQRRYTQWALQWVASPQTLNKIYDRLKILEKQKRTT